MTSPILYVFKVFKVGYSMVDLRNQWLLALFHKLYPKHEKILKECLAFCRLIYNERLLSNGRFAFAIGREWGNLQKLLDVRIQHNGNKCFMMPDDNYFEKCVVKMIWQIAEGMRGMYKEGTLHRDLKAPNVLINDYNKKPLENAESESTFIQRGIFLSNCRF